MGTNHSKRDLCERYEELYTGVVADVLDDYGFEDQTLDHRIKPLTRDMCAAGIAYPAVGRANRSVDPDRQVRRFLEMVDGAPEDSMLVLNTNDTTAAHIGELTTTALDNNGCRGAVIEGGLRDTEFITEQGYPVFVSHRTPLDSILRWELVDWDTTAVVGGVSVSPGDVVVADVDGVVVVPEAVAGEVLEDAETEKTTEDELRAAIDGGMSAVDAYDEYGTF